MSEQAPEAPPRRENVFTRKIGPLPMWAWVTIIAAALIGWAYYRNKKSQSQQDQAAAGTDASQVPQFVNQTYTTVQPPSAPVTPAPTPIVVQTTPEDEQEPPPRPIIPGPNTPPRPRPRPRPKPRPKPKRRPVHKPVEFSGGPVAGLMPGVPPVR